MPSSGDKRGIFEAIIFSLALMVFSFFIRAGFPVKIIAILSMLIPAFLIARNTRSFCDLKGITGSSTDRKSLLIYSVIGLALGLFLSIFYRWRLNSDLLPSAFGSFAPVACLIGITEELVFRGYLQGSLRTGNPLTAVILSTAAHTGYKCCLFLSPFSLSGIEVGLLMFWTFLIGLVYGAIRHYSGSIIPSLLSHGFFDILVYGELTSAPLWVW